MSCEGFIIKGLTLFRKPLTSTGFGPTLNLKKGGFTSFWGPGLLVWGPIFYLTFLG